MGPQVSVDARTLDAYESAKVQTRPGWICEENLKNNFFVCVCVLLCMFYSEDHKNHPHNEDIFDLDLMTSRGCLRVQTWFWCYGLNSVCKRAKSSASVPEIYSYRFIKGRSSEKSAVMLPGGDEQYGYSEMQRQM